MPGTPVLRETRHDRTAASLLSVVASLMVLVVVLGTVALNGMEVEPPEPIVLIEYVELDSEDTGPAETDPQLEPVDEAPSSEMSEPGGMTESMSSITELTADVSPIAVRQFESLQPPTDEAAEQISDGVSGSSARTRSSIGSARCGGGLPPEQRWFIRFDDSTLHQYARQLDFFGIELGAYVPARPPRRARLTYLKGAASSDPLVRKSDGSSDERLYLAWHSAKHAARDRALFLEAGVDEPDAIYLLFLNAETERLIQQVEEDYRDKKVTEIRRTYFRVVPNGEGFRFVVFSQSYLR